jgi:hypothetical protein
MFMIVTLAGTSPSITPIGHFQDLQTCDGAAEVARIRPKTNGGHLPTALDIAFVCISVGNKPITEKK